MAKFVAKKHLVRSPTLLIGIGGIGGQIVTAVNSAMSDYDKSCIKMLVMDTDSNALSTISNTSIPYIQTSENKTVQGYLSSHPEFLDWFPTEPFINGKNLIDGAGQIRSVSRLGALASKSAGHFKAIKDAVDSILSNQGDPVKRAVRVMIVGSATGGTGSGLGIQLPFYIRKVLSDANVPNVLIRGMFLMPSLTDSVQDTDAKERAVNVNGYAFLKELNAFYRAQKMTVDENNLRIEEYVPGMRSLQNSNSEIVTTAPIPYEFLYLIEKHSNQGVLGSLETYIERTSKIILNQLFSPISAKGFSAEDNLITSAVPKQGMNRYCGAGISNAVYPKEEVLEYCTVRYAEQLIGDYWLKVDDLFIAQDEQQQRLRKTNPNIEPLDKGKTYCKIFDDMSDPTKQTVASEVAALKRDLTLKLTDKEGKVTRSSLVDVLFNSIEDRIEKVYLESGLLTMRDQCLMTSTSTCNPDDVATDVVEKMEKLREFSDEATKKVSELVVSTVEEILPSNLKLAQGFSSNLTYNIYTVIRDKHPIIARYVFYSLLERFKEKLDNAESSRNSTIIRMSIFDKDYYLEDGEDRHKETPREAIQKTKKGWLSWLNVYSASYKALVDTLIEDVAGEAHNTLERAKHTLESTVCNSIIERLKVLIELYENFFNELRTIMENKKREKESLESGRGVGPNDTLSGDKYICCDAQCKRFLYDEFTHRVKDADMEMSKDVKEKFFDKMFEEFEAQLLESNNKTAAVVHHSAEDLFEDGILNPIVEQFAENGFKHLDMGILDAIYKQYQIKNGASAKDKKSPEFATYFRSICQTMCTLAEPYMLYETEVAGYNSGGKLSYAWGLNHAAVADFQFGNASRESIDTASLSNLFGIGYSAPLTDDSFSPYSMVCYATIYDLCIENCISYKRGSTAEKYYADRLNNLAARAHFVLSNNRDNELDVIHPHLDLRWHEHAFLPELMGYDEEEMSENIRRSFLLGTVLDRCSFIKNDVDCINCWCFLDEDKETGRKNWIPINIAGEEVRSASAFALYNSFEYNRVMVQKILEYAENVKNDSYNNSSFGGIQYTDVLNQEIIKNMCGGEKDSKKLSILDVLYELYKASGNREQNRVLVETLETYLKDYCLYMMNRDENRATALLKKVLLEIGNSASCLKDEGVSQFFKADVSRFLP